MNGPLKGSLKGDLLPKPRRDKVNFEGISSTQYSIHGCLGKIKKDFSPPFLRNDPRTENPASMLKGGKRVKSAFYGLSCYSVIRREGGKKGRRAEVHPEKSIWRRKKSSLLWAYSHTCVWQYDHYL